LGQVEIDKLERDKEVRLIEIILDIPSNLAKLLSLLNSCMEE
jgi:hypothetical protein